MSENNFSITFNFKKGKLDNVREIELTGVQSDPEYPLKLSKIEHNNIYKIIKNYCKNIKEDELTKFLRKAKDSLNQEQLKELGDMLKPKD